MDDFQLKKMKEGNVTTTKLEMTAVVPVSGLILGRLIIYFIYYILFFIFLFYLFFYLNDFFSFVYFILFIREFLFLESFYLFIYGIIYFFISFPRFQIHVQEHNTFLELWGIPLPQDSGLYINTVISCI